MLSREVTTLECVHHPNILRLFEVVETLGRVHLVTEWIRGGELYNRITHGGPLKEPHAATLFKQLLLAVQHMHSLGFVHRDIKAENVLMVSEDRIKLADFGFSTQLINGAQQHLDTFCGSPPYAAPELFSDDHYIGGLVDVWALGVLIYFMVVGNMPFRAPTVPALRAAVLKGDYPLPSFLSLPCTRVIQRILVHTPSRRPTIDQMLASQWVNQYPPLPIVNAVPTKSIKKTNSWFAKNQAVRKSNSKKDRHKDTPHFTVILCNTKRANSVLVDSFLNPLDVPLRKLSDEMIDVPPVTATKPSGRKSIFHSAMKKKIGPMEDVEFGKMFTRNSIDLKLTTLDIGSHIDGDIKLDEKEPDGNCVNELNYEDEQGDYVMGPTCTHNIEDLHPLEIETRQIMAKMGLTSDMLCRAIDSGPRSDIIGIYRIVVHRLQKQLLMAKQIEALPPVNTDNIASVRSKSNKSCAIL